MPISRPCRSKMVTCDRPAVPGRQATTPVRDTEKCATWNAGEDATRFWTNSGWPSSFLAVRFSVCAYRLSFRTNSRRPDVGALVDGPATRLLGTHVGGRAENHPGARHRGRRDRRRLRHEGALRLRIRRLHRLRQPEVEHLHRAVRRTLMFAGLRSR